MVILMYFVMLECNFGYNLFFFFFFFFFMYLNFFLDTEGNTHGQSHLSAGFGIHPIII